MDNCAWGCPNELFHFKKRLENFFSLEWLVSWFISWFACFLLNPRTGLEKRNSVPQGFIYTQTHTCMHAQLHTCRHTMGLESRWDSSWRFTAVYSKMDLPLSMERQCLPTHTHTHIHARYLGERGSEHILTMRE